MNPDRIHGMYQDTIRNPTEVDTAAMDCERMAEQGMERMGFQRDPISEDERRAMLFHSYCMHGGSHDESWKHAVRVVDEFCKRYMGDAK